jgi:hypothetical protein
MKKNMKKIIREKRAHIKMNIYTWCEKFTKGVCILWPQSDDWMETSQHNLQFQVQIEEEYSDWSLISCKDLYGEQKFVKQQQLTGIKDGPVTLLQRWRCPHHARARAAPVEETWGRGKYARVSMQSRGGTQMDGRGQRNPRCTATGGARAPHQHHSKKELGNV